MRIFAVGTKILGGGLANIWGGLCPPGPNVEPPLAERIPTTDDAVCPTICVSQTAVTVQFTTGCPAGNAALRPTISS